MLPKFLILGFLCLSTVRAYAFDDPSGIATLISAAPDFIGTIIVSILWSMDTKRKNAEQKMLLDRLLEKETERKTGDD